MRILNLNELDSISAGLLLHKNGDYMTIGLQDPDEDFMFYNLRFTSEGWTSGYYLPISVNQVHVLDDLSGLPDKNLWKACFAVYIVNLTGIL